MGGGGPPVGPKDQLFPFFSFFLKAFLSKEYRQQIIKANKDTDKDNDNCTMNAKQWSKKMDTSNPWENADTSKNHDNHVSDNYQ